MVHSDHRGGSLDLDRLGEGATELSIFSCLFGGERSQKLSAGGFIVESAGLHPGVVSELLARSSVVTVEGEEVEDEVLELLREAGAVNLLEVGIGLALEKQVVEVLFLAGLLEGEDALDDDEEDDSDGEHVNIGSLVLLAQLDLGSHVGHGTTVRVECIDVLVAGEAEVGDLEVEVVINKDVLEFEVSVDNSAGVHVLD